MRVWLYYAMSSHLIFKMKRMLNYPDLIKQTGKLELTLNIITFYGYPLFSTFKYLSMSLLCGIYSCEALI